jgi:hypothetical protein
LRQDLAEKVAELAAIQDRSTELTASLTAKREELEQQLTAKHEALLVANKEIDGLKRSLGKLSAFVFWYRVTLNLTSSCL